MLSSKDLSIIHLLWKGKSFNYIQETLRTSKVYINKLLERTGFKIFKELMNEEGLHYCTKCKMYKNLDKFKLRKTKNKVILNSFCRPCSRYVASERIYKKLNKDKINKAAKEWRKNNKDKVREYRLRYYAKIKEDPSKFLKCRLRSALSESIGFSKNTHYFRLLGYSSEDLKEHLSLKFQDGMSWSNYGSGGWHIDHIKPLASFDLKDPQDFRRAWSLSNLQPLWEADNLRKSSYYKGKLYRKSTLK